jgi:Ca2+-binding EF-hand superfamily protein
MTFGNQVTRLCHLLLAAGLLFVCVESRAEPAPPIRLAIISQGTAVAPIADLLTAELSKDQNLALLERDQIAKVLREQTLDLSHGGKNLVQVGQILGADGLLILQNAPKGAGGEPSFFVRLVAVKPGVVLAVEEHPVSIINRPEWPAEFAGHMKALLPKLSVLPKDAIPISIVNLRSAVSSDEGKETERELKPLTILRLTQEKQFFVLERQQLQQLAGEKDLQQDDSPFWNGSYLLDGVADQNGYSKDTITLNARLTPPKGGRPIPIEITASRTNLVELANQLALKIDEALKITSSAPAWSGAEEARQYLDEARWALKWKIYSEAQSAAESAWALGKMDLECALVRVNSYVQEIPELADPNVGRFDLFHPQTAVRYVHINETPDPRLCGVALNALERYHEFCRSSPDGQPKVEKFRDSDWYRLGVEAVNGASRVLAHFCYVQSAQPAVADELAELRSETRAVAALIASAPSVHDSYFVGDRVATHDELDQTMQTQPTIFRSMADCGCFWQERPEDTLALYRNLLSSPVFRYVQADVWNRPFGRPRLAGWNAEDRIRIPSLWKGFVREMAASTNLLTRLEAKAFTVADDRMDQQKVADFTNFIDTLITNQEELVANPVDILYLDWDVGALVPTSGQVTTVTESLQELYWKKYRAQLQDMEQEYWRKTVPALKFTPKFQAQVEYLKSKKPYDFLEFAQLFGERNYTKAQAQEILPLASAYKSNLLTRIQNASTQEKVHLQGADFFVGAFESSVKNVLNSTNQPRVVVRKAGANPFLPPPRTNGVAENITNVITVNRFLEIPLAGLPGNPEGGVQISAHHWVEGKLLLDLQYSKYETTTNGTFLQTRTITYSAVAVYDPKTFLWNVIAGPPLDMDGRDPYYNFTTLWHRNVYSAFNNQIHKYDSDTKKWEVLAISDGNEYQLLNVNDHLYAANDTTVFEILDEGRSTRLMASSRRNPPASALDSLSLGTPSLFEGPEHSLRIVAESKIFTWNSNDWRLDCNAPLPKLGVYYFPSGVLFGLSGNRKFYRVSFLSTNAIAPDTYLAGNVPTPGFDLRETSTPPSKGIWSVPHSRLDDLAAAPWRSNLLVLQDHSETEPIVDSQQNVIVGERILAKGGAHAELQVFSRGAPLPQEVFLKFDSPNAQPPTLGHRAFNPFTGANASTPVWMMPVDDNLYIGKENPFRMFSPTPLPARKAIIYKTGVWVLNMQEIQPLIAAQEHKQLGEIAEEAAESAKARKNVFEKYDVNHNGVIDPEEREAALDDPDFIKLELDTIDNDHSGFLEPEKLKYFDANGDKVLDPKEESGIRIAQRLLAERLLKKFDEDGDGLLSYQERENLIHSLRRPEQNMAQSWFGQNGMSLGTSLDLKALESFVKAETEFGLQPYIMGIPRTPGQPQLRGEEWFKAVVEAYWAGRRHPVHQMRFPPGIAPPSP